MPHDVNARSVILWVPRRFEPIPAQARQERREKRRKQQRACQGAAAGLHTLLANLSNEDEDGGLTCMSVSLQDLHHPVLGMAEDADVNVLPTANLNIFVAAFTTCYNKTPLIKPNFCILLPHRRSTTVSLETTPSFICYNKLY